MTLPTNGTGSYKAPRPPSPACPAHGYAMRIRRTVRTEIDGKPGIIRYCYCPDPECREAIKQAQWN